MSTLGYCARCDYAYPANERAEHRHEPTPEQIRVRYPRLLRAIRYVGILSEGEAVSCIRSYLIGDDYACEAVANFGGAKAMLKAGSRASVRHYIGMFDRYPFRPEDYR